MKGVINPFSLKELLLFLMILSASYGMVLGAHVLARGGEEEALTNKESFVACECAGFEGELSSETLEECCN